MAQRQIPGDPKQRSGLRKVLTLPNVDNHLPTYLHDAEE